MDPVKDPVVDSELPVTLYCTVQMLPAVPPYRKAVIIVIFFPEHYVNT